MAKKAVKKVSKKKVVKKAAKKAVKKSVSKAAKSTTSKKVVKKAAKKSVKKASPKKSNAVKSIKTAPESQDKSSVPAVGSLAPDFEAASDTHGALKLSDYRGSNVVLYFYPKDDTPGCTKEACSFQENKAKLSDANAVVIGVSPDSVASHGKFRTKYGLDFLLVADEEREICNAYGVWVEKNNYGKKYMGVQRATFLIDRNGLVARVWPRVSVDGHTEQVLGELGKLV